MKAYTAETGSRIVMLAAGDVDRHTFAGRVARYLSDTPQDEATPRSVVLYEWPDMATLAAWIEGRLPAPGESWTTMSARARYGRVVLQYLGGGDAEYQYAPDDVAPVVAAIPAGEGRGWGDWPDPRD